MSLDTPLSIRRYMQQNMSKLRANPDIPTWYTSLLLLGYRENDFPVVLTHTMFDHSNPPGFQQVFHFLLTILHPERTRAEFRDCWPILSKKQEAEFRRKIVMFVKEIAREAVMAPLPSTNAALFMSPGGTRFKVFLSAVVNHVMREMLLRSEDLVLGGRKGVVEATGRLRRGQLYRYYKFKEGKNRETLRDQQAIKDLEIRSRESMAAMEKEYLGLRAGGEGGGEGQEDHLISLHPGLVVEGRMDQEGILGEYDTRCSKVKDTKDTFKCRIKVISGHWDSIIQVMDELRPKLCLNLDSLPRDVVHPSSLANTHSALISRFLATAGQALELPQPSLPIHPVSLIVETAAQQHCALDQLEKELEDSVAQLRNSVAAKMEESGQIDWTTCPLAPPLRAGEEDVGLLPPTPCLLPRLSPGSVEGTLTPRLQLSSPAPTATDTPSSNPDMMLTVPGQSCLPSTPPASLGQLTRRFPRKITPDQSPLLRQSLIQSTLRRNSDCQGDSTKDSLGVFSPVLSSTLSHNILSSSEELQIPRQSPTFRELRLQSDIEDSSETASKIEMYRQILKTVKKESQAPAPPRGEARASLLQVWSSQRQLLSPSPGADTRMDSPPALATEWETPRVNRRGTQDRESSVEVDSRVVTRLDLLMQDSLTLSDTSTLDLSLGSLSLGEDLLSPHHP